MTSIRERFENIQEEIEAIKQTLEAKGEISCCLTHHKDGRMSCASSFPLSEEQFRVFCSACKWQIQRWLERLEK